MKTWRVLGLVMMSSGWLALADGQLRIGGTDVVTILKKLGAEMEQGTTHQQLDSYSRSFDRIDRNHDGRHSKVEYVDNGRYLTLPARAGIFNAADNDKDGFVTKAEYVLNRIITDEAKLIVQAMDEDQDGAVQRNEFIKNVMMDNKELAEQVFEALDVNDDDKLSTPEYLRVWGQWARDGQPTAEQRISARIRISP